MFKLAFLEISAKCQIFAVSQIITTYYAINHVNGDNEKIINITAIAFTSYDVDRKYHIIIAIVVIAASHKITS